MLIHHLITLYFLLFPYVIPRDNILIFIYLLTLLSLVIHWVTNDNKCCITEMERLLTGTDDTYTKKVLDPFFTLNNSQCAWIGYWVVIVNGLYAINNITR